MVSSGGEAPRIEKAVAVRVSSLADLVRLSATLASRMIVMPVYRLRLERGAVYFVQMMYKDYYKYYGVPVIYYYIDESDTRESGEANYILAKTDETGEHIELSSRTRPGWLVIPVINLESPPVYLPEEVLGSRGNA